MKPRIVYLSLALLVLAACDPPPPLGVKERTIIHCIENMPFECRGEPPQGASFFRADIDGQTYCVSTADEHYFFSPGFITTQATPASDPVLKHDTPVLVRSVVFRLWPQLREAGGLPYEFLPGIILLIPYDADTAQPRRYYVDKYLSGQEGRMLPLKETLLSGEGFGLELSWACYYLPGYDFYRAKESSTGLPPPVPSVYVTLASFAIESGRHPRNVRIWVERFEREELNDYDIRYRIVFRFEGSFRFWNKGFPDVEIKDGVYDVNFVLPKEE